MTVFYMDLENGDDAQDGLSFANRWKTFATGATAARIAPGDTIRIMASPDPIDTGLDADFTNDSATVTLSAAVTQAIYSDGAWTSAGGANVVCTTTTNRKEGATSASIAIAAGFGTGLAAYYATGTLDLSGYEQVTFWLAQSAGTAAVAGDYELRLCTDAAGVTGVHTAPIPAMNTGTAWTPITVDLGAALNSAIQSIAFYVNVDRGAVTFFVDNVAAAKDSTLDDAITLTSLIGKNVAGDAWWAIHSLVGTTLILERVPGTTGTGINPGYWGATETVALWRRETIKQTIISNDNVSNNTVQDSGSLAGGQITFSGGWNRTDMSTQTGETHIEGKDGRGRGVDFTNRSFITFDKISTYRFVRGWRGSGNSNIVFTPDCHTAHNSSAMVEITAPSAVPSVLPTHFGIGHSGGIFHMSALNGDVEVDAIYNSGQAPGGVTLQGHGRAVIGRIYGALSGVGLCTEQTSVTLRGPWDVTADVIEKCAGGAQLGVGTILRGATFSGNTGQSVAAASNESAGDIKFYDCDFQDATEFAAIGVGRDIMFCSERHDKTEGAAKQVTDGGTITKVSGPAWQFAVTSTNRDEAYPLRTVLMRIGVKAEQEVNVSVDINRSNTGLSARIRCRGGQVAGVAADVEDSAAGSAGVDEALSIAFTPTEDGVVEIEGLAWGGTTYTCDFKNFDAD